MKDIFVPADIILPESPNSGWSVIACDQFTSEPEYWQRVKEAAARPSTLDMIIPEAYLSTVDVDAESAKCNKAMADFLAGGKYTLIRDSFIYIERTLPDGRLRRGIVGALDLDEYEYTPDSCAPVRASEKTVTERIGPRVQLRRGASLELPHVMVLLNDPMLTVTEPLTAIRDSLETVYDFDLMEDGGHICGKRVCGEDARRVMDAIAAIDSDPVMAIGDGNHSLASAKACWDELKAQGAGFDHPARYALVEVNNIYDDGVGFEPIHRAVFGVDTAALESMLRSEFAGCDGWPVRCITADSEFMLYVPADTLGSFIAVFQKALDTCTEKLCGTLDYIHGDDSVAALAAKPGSMGFFLPAADKAELFGTVAKDGVFPAKSFSIGVAREKRYYLECRKITV